MSKSINSQRTAIVTGAAGDLGSVIALRLAEEGYKVSITDLPSRLTELQRTANAIAKTGAAFFLVTGDVTKEEDVQTIVAETVKNLGPLDVMVSNVGKFTGRLLTSFSIEDWDDLFNVNVKTMMLCYKTAANQMLKQKAEDKDREAHYRIIGLTLAYDRQQAAKSHYAGGGSVAGLTGAPLCSGYAASKFAVRGLTQVAANELGPSGITVNAYASGFVGGTAMWDKLENTVMNTFGLPEGAWRVQATESIKTKQLGEPRNIAAIVSYLASPDANWTTGQMIAVDGGMHLA
ncbi:acetoin reductase family protein [Ramaria rubella]|nr:acetoin reductase family protein [Ramaria rubella]